MYMSSCVFCAILNKEIPARIIAENENALAFLDVNPIADGHTVVISKNHYKYLSETPTEVLSDMIKLCHEVANKIANSSLKPSLIKKPSFKPNGGFSYILFYSNS